MPARRAARPAFRALPAVVAVMAVLLMTLATGCSMSDAEDLGYTPQVRKTERPLAEAQDLSSRLYDLLRLKGKTTPSGPILDMCGDLDADTYYKVRHSWSVYGRSDASLTRAWERLKTELPEHGWKITDRGTESDKAKTPFMMADSREKKFTVRVTLELVPEDREPAKGEESGIMFSLVSACFRVPEGTEVH